MAQVVTHQSAQSSLLRLHETFFLRRLNVFVIALKYPLVLILNVVDSETRHHLSCNPRRTNSIRRYFYVKLIFTQLFQSTIYTTADSKGVQTA
jgi:hypothetical protein